MTFANGKNLDSASAQEDYPADVWQQATAKWNSLQADDRAQQMQAASQERQQAISALYGAARSSAFIGSFSPFDLLWFGLAAATAYRLGAGNSSDD